LNTEQQTGQLPKQCEAGRKPKEESRADELRQALIAWKQIPEAVRPSLRFLAAQLRTNHQLLSHFLGTLDEWELEERIRLTKSESERISARVEAEGRRMTLDEVRRTVILPALLDLIYRDAQDLKRGPLHPKRIQMLRMMASQFPEAGALLQKCSQDKRPCAKKRLELTEKQEAYVKTLSKANARRYKRWLADESPGDLDLS
jgi:hypothetical protein